MDYDVMDTLFSGREEGRSGLWKAALTNKPNATNKLKNKQIDRKQMNKQT